MHVLFIFVIMRLTKISEDIYINKWVYTNAFYVGSYTVSSSMESLHLLYLILSSLAEKNLKGLFNYSCF